jgi:hypothetical protein
MQKTSKKKILDIYVKAEIAKSARRNPSYGDR